jgi:hypothetical protein
MSRIEKFAEPQPQPHARTDCTEQVFPLSNLTDDIGQSLGPFRVTLGNSFKTRCDGSQL